MKWALRLTTWWMNFASQLASWMLLCGRVVSKEDSRVHTVLVQSKNGSIVRTFPGGMLFQSLPLVLPLTNMEKPSTTWLLLTTTSPMLAKLGSAGEESGEAGKIWFILSFQEPQRGPWNAERTS